MKEIQNIFTSIDDSENTDADAHYLSELITFQIDSFQFHSAVDQNDPSIIFYVAGAISRTLLKKNKCQMCEELLSSGKMDTATIQFDNIDAKREFMFQEVAL